MEFQTKISFFAGIVVCALLITPFFSKGSFIALGAAAPIEKSAGGMTSVSSDFPRAPARPCKTTHPTRKDRRPLRRRRCAHEVWVGDGAPTLPIWNDGVAPNVHSARQRLSKRNGRDAAPSASDFCGAAAFVKQHVELEKIVVRPGDGAVRLKFGSATARQPYQFGTTGDAQRASGAAAPIEERW